MQALLQSVFGVTARQTGGAASLECESGLLHELHAGTVPGRSTPLASLTMLTHVLTELQVHVHA